MCHVFRASYKVVLLHSPQVHSGLCPQGCDALPGELRQGQSAVGAGDASLQVGGGGHAAE